MRIARATLRSCYRLRSEGEQGEKRTGRNRENDGDERVRRKLQSCSSSSDLTLSLSLARPPARASLSNADGHLTRLGSQLERPSKDEFVDVMLPWERFSNKSVWRSDFGPAISSPRATERRRQRPQLSLNRAVNLHQKIDPTLPAAQELTGAGVQN